MEIPSEYQIPRISQLSKLDRDMTCDPNYNYSILDNQACTSQIKIKKFNKYKHKKSNWITNGLLKSINLKLICINH